MWMEIFGALVVTLYSLKGLSKPRKMRVMLTDSNGSIHPDEW